MTFARLLSEVLTDELPRTGDVLAVGMPLLRHIDSLHRHGQVTGASGVSALDYDGTRLHVSGSQPAGEDSNRPAVELATAHLASSGAQLWSHRQHDDSGGGWGRTSSLDVFDPDDGVPPRPMFVAGYRVWEQLHGHHDPLTDVALCGLWLCSFAFGLDLDTPDGIDALALDHRHPSRLNPHLHPVVASTLVSMIAPDRSLRPRELGHVITRLEHHRDVPADLDLAAAYESETDWRRAVLTTLRDRVFDTTRRNRELYYRPTASSVSLTESSVPLMLNIDRIRPKDLLTWTSPSNDALRKGKTVDLATWCRFEETPYLAPALDKLISAERKFRVETGHGRLRCIVAFLHWHDPEADEAVTSPLLTLPATLTRKKGLETRYQLELPGDDATVNPILRHVFAGRFGIDLPAHVGTGPDEIAAFAQTLEAQVRKSAPAVQIELVDKPRIDLLRRKAQLRVDNYRRRRARNLASAGRWRRQDHSYELDDWRPLGQALYDRFVRTADLPLRDVAGAVPRPRPQALSAPTDAAPPPPGLPSEERTADIYSITGADASADRWQVDLCSVSLAVLGSRRTTLSRDYDDVLRAESTVTVEDTPFEHLFRPEPSPAPAAETEPMRIDQRLVLPADDAQARAVQRAVRGDSFIIQGPPGTGKSQTITNVIAALAAAGKRVLFVCEKRAAIDVVAHRLNQVGLSDLTALIHDSQLDRKDFVKQLGATYHSWLDDRPDEPADGQPPAPSETQVRRNQLLARFGEAVRPLDAMNGELGASLGGGLTVAQAIERVSLLSEAGSDAAVPLAPDEWVSLRPRLDRVADALAAAGFTGPLASHAALRVRPGYLGADAVQSARNVGAALTDAVGGVVPTLDLAAITTSGSWQPTLLAAAEAGGLAALDPTHPQHLDLRAAAQRQTELDAFVAETGTVLTRWVTPLSAADTAAGLDVARSKEGSIFKVFNGRWRALRKTVEAAYDFGQHQVRPTITAVLEELHAHHTAVAAATAHAATNEGTFGSADAVVLRAFVDDNHARPGYSDLVGAGASLRDRLQQNTAIADAVSPLLVSSTITVADLERLGAELQATPIGVEPALLAWADIGAAPEEGLLGLVDANASLDVIEAGVLRRELDRWASTIDHVAFSGAHIDHAIDTARSIHSDLLDINATVVIEAARAAFLANIAHADASMAGRSDDDKARKRVYNAGRRIVEREYEKKMRHRSIREMATGESGVVVRDLRPIWLMSPLSVSDTLPLETDLFDVVIFDEASQIPVEDAVPSVLRAPQVIVVGDRMQMPPTRFFSSDDDDDAELVVDDHGHRLSITLDADSFLTQADLALDSSMLNWHYRSRSESLIAYSNHAFYGGGLATIPDTELPSGEQPAIKVDSADDAIANTATTLERAISFHHVDHGEYRDRRNVPEADYIAELVRSVLRSGVGHTIGIVAFSEAQQGAIESALDDLAAIDADFAERYEAEQSRTDDDEFVGLFVKNLENVQGDERDLIIMSVCYGPDPHGRIRMNFGPINNSGGERRLNVIFSRARKHMAVVASMRGNQITNLHNDGASHLAGFLSYAEAESLGRVDAATALLRTASRQRHESHASSPVADAMAEALRANGWTVTTSVGRSDFRIDLAITVDGDHRVGVLLEPDDGERAVSRNVTEAGVLDAFGWTILRVPLSDWYTDPARVIDRVEANLPHRTE